MSEAVRKVNGFFKTALKEEIDSLQEKLSLSDRQMKIFRMFYIKKQDVNFIGDTMGVCPQVVGNELRAIRKKILKAL